VTARIRIIANAVTTKKRAGRQLIRSEEIPFRPRSPGRM
jgi:hypothetical protein